MNKKGLQKKVAMRMGVGIAEASECVDAVFDGIAEGLAEDGRAMFIGFGSFSVKTRKPQYKRNPRKPNELLFVPKHNYVRFHPGDALKEAAKKRPLD